MTGVALGALIVAAGGTFLLSPFNTIVPVPASVLGVASQVQQAVAGLSSPAPLGASASTQPSEPGTRAATTTTPSSQAQPSSTRDAVVAPAASLAATALPRRGSSVTTKPYAEQSRTQTLQELVGLGASRPDATPSTTTEAPAETKPAKAVASNSTPTSPVAVTEPGSTTLPTAAPDAHKLPANDITGPVMQAALGQTGAVPPAEPVRPTIVSPATVHPETALSPTQAVAPPQDTTPATSSSLAVSRQEASAGKPPVLVLSVPAGHQEQAEVLQYVTGLTSELARLRTENDLLRKDVARRMNEQEARLADYNRRLSVAEARAALKAATDVGKSDDATATGAVASKLPVQTISMAAPPSQVMNARAPAASEAKVRYRVQAASPGLALLAEVGRGGGEGAQLQVAVGDQIPGYGVVKSVAQRGPNWVVQTEHGAID